jgi:hypothetical protein
VVAGGKRGKDFGKQNMLAPLKEMNSEMELFLCSPDKLVSIMNPRLIFVVAGKRWRRCEWRISLYQSLDTEMKSSNLSALTLLGTR